MKREIKFRAWDKKENKIKYSYEYPDLPCFFTLNQCQLGQEMYPIMQYTGLKDKNGKEIYEGDIVKYIKHEGYLLDNFIGEVYWDGVQFVIDSYTGNSVEFARVDELWNDILSHLEIIGNVFENPELLNNHE